MKNNAWRPKPSKLFFLLITKGARKTDRRTGGHSDSRTVGQTDNRQTDSRTDGQSTDGQSD